MEFMLFNDLKTFLLSRRSLVGSGDGRTGQGRVWVDNLVCAYGVLFSKMDVANNAFIALISPLLS